MPLPERQLTILLVEDDEGHARLIERNLRRSNVANAILHVRDGRQALDLIFGEGSCQGQERPQHLLVLLDVNMPVLDGYQVLERLKRDDRTRKIPVVMLTTTDDEQEMQRGYDLGCNAYVTKPVDYAAFCRVIQELGLFISVLAVPA